MEQHISMVVISLLLLAYPRTPPVASQTGPDPSCPAWQPEVELRGQPGRITLRPATLAHAVDELAGQRVRIVNARVVGVFESQSFLIESAAGYEAALGMRDRVVVLIDGGSLRVSPELLVRSSVVILGIARTLLGLRVSPELPWPSVLDQERIERLEVRAAVLATSVRTAEGTELTRRTPPDQRRPGCPTVIGQNPGLATRGSGTAIRSGGVGVRN